MCAIGDNPVVNVKPIVFIAVAFAVVAALWLFFKPHHVEPQAADGAIVAGAHAPSTMNLPNNGSGPGVQARPQDVFDLQIKGGKAVAGPVLIQVHEGEQVTINIKSDSADELHLHGYDLHAHIAPDQTAILQFTANHTGRFGMELHKARTELGALEVYPR
jgi:hypothetical protein